MNSVVISIVVISSMYGVCFVVVKIFQNILFVGFIFNISPNAL